MQYVAMNLSFCTTNYKSISKGRVKTRSRKVGGQLRCDLDYTMTTTHCYHDNYTQWHFDSYPVI